MGSEEAEIDEARTAAQRMAAEASRQLCTFDSKLGAELQRQESASTGLELLFNVKQLPFGLYTGSQCPALLQG